MHDRLCRVLRSCGRLVCHELALPNCPQPDETWGALHTICEMARVRHITCAVRRDIGNVTQTHLMQIAAFFDRASRLDRWRSAPPDVTFTLEGTGHTWRPFMKAMRENSVDVHARWWHTNFVEPLQRSRVHIVDLYKDSYEVRVDHADGYIPLVIVPAIGSSIASIRIEVGTPNAQATRLSRKRPGSVVGLESMRRAMPRLESFQYAYETTLRNSKAFIVRNLRHFARLSSDGGLRYADRGGNVETVECDDKT